MGKTQAELFERKQIQAAVTNSTGAITEVLVGMLAEAAYITAVYFTSATALAASNTDYSTLTLKAKGANGAGTTVVASCTTKAASGGAITANVPFLVGNELGLPVDGALVVTGEANLIPAGTALTFAAAKTSSGSVGDGIVTIEYSTSPSIANAAL